MSLFPLTGKTFFRPRARIDHPRCIHPKYQLHKEGRRFDDWGGGQYSPSVKLDEESQSDRNARRLVLAVVPATPLWCCPRRSLRGDWRRKDRRHCFLFFFRQTSVCMRLVLNRSFARLAGGPLDIGRVVMTTCRTHPAC
jgi:hypothetical protein